MKNLHSVDSTLGKRVQPKARDKSSPVRGLGYLAIAASLVLAVEGAHAAAPVVRYSFEDAGLTTDTNSLSVVVVLTNFNAAGTATDLHGVAGTGVSGQLDGNRALTLTNASYVTSGGVNGPGAFVASSSSLATALGGTITSFTATEWFNGTVLPPVNALLGRMFLLGPGTAATDINSANTIGMKWQQPNQWNVSIGTGNPTATAIFPANLPINKWLFMAIVYDNTNVMIYQGSDTASAQLISTTPAPGLVTSLGSTAGLYVGNRNTRQRAYVGWIDEFRFYTNASSASDVEAIRQESAGGGPVATGFYPDGLMLQQATNEFAFTALSPSGVWGPGTNITGIQMTLNGRDVSSQLLVVTNGTPGTSTNLSVSYNGLQQDQTNTVLITLHDALGKVGTSTLVFDTFSPANFVWEAEEFDHDNGVGTNTDYTSYATNTSFYGLDSVEGVDTHKGTPGTGFNASDYRAGSTDGTRTQTPAVSDTTRQKFLNLVAAGDGNVVDHVVGNWSSGEWQNYTRTFPAGNYNVYARMSSAASATLTLAQVTSGWGTPSQTTVNLGTFAMAGTAMTTYQWVPLKNSLGNFAVVNLGGFNTVRVTSGGGANANYYMLVPANTNLPSISGIYPNGQVLFQVTNKLVFTASSAVTTINVNSITLSLNGTNVSSSLGFSGGPSTWNVSYTGLQTNRTYTAVISVTDANGSTATSTFTFDTWNPVFQVEAEDFDFNNGQYIDNPVPTTGPAANSYFGQVGTLNVDESNNGSSPPYAGASSENYRNTDPIATTKLTAAEAARQQFLSAGAPDYNVGFLGPFFWQNYTRTWPSGTFNVYARIASGAATPLTQHLGFDQITGGWGTTAQGIKHIGGFNIPRTGGWSAYAYVPLIDSFGNYANVTLSGTNTFRATFARSLGIDYPGDADVGAANINFYMLVAARTDLARLDGIYPDGAAHFQATNRFSFTASSASGISTNNIVVTLNGMNISSNLVFTGSSTSWNVSYSGLAPNATYTVTLQVTDNNGSVATTTVTFDTFSPANFTWQAEDYDFNSGQYIDNPMPTSIPAVNSYFGQSGTISVDYDYMQTVAGETFLYRPSDYIGTQLSADTLLPGYVTAQQADGAANYNVAFWQTNAWMNYTRTFPTGNFIVYGRLAGGGVVGLPYTNALYEVTSGWGTANQTTNLLGTFQGVGAGPQAWQWVRLSDNNGQPAVLSLSGTNTLRVATLSGNANADFFMLVPAPSPVNLTASRSGQNVLLSFPTQDGLSYTVQYKDDLSGSTWTSLPQGTAIGGNGSVKSVIDSPPGAKRFYRLAIPIP